MAQQNLPLGQAFGAGGVNILAADFFEKHIFGEHRHYRQITRHRGGNRQRHVPEIILNFGRPAQALPIIAHQAALRKPGKKAAATKQHQQHEAEHKRRNGVAQQNQHAGGGIKTRAVAHGFDNAQRNADKISKEKSPQPQAHRHRHFFFHQLKHGLVVEKALAQIEAGKAGNHVAETLQRRLVKAVERIERGHIVGAQMAAAAHQRARGRSSGFAAHAALGELLHHLLHRPAGHKLDNGKRNRQNAQQRGNQQQQSLENIAPHVRGLFKIKRVIIAKIKAV